MELGCRLGRNRDRLPSPAPLHTKSKLRGLFSPPGRHGAAVSNSLLPVCLHALLLSSLFTPLQSWRSPGHSSDLPGTCLSQGLRTNLTPLSSLDTCIVMPLASSALCPKEASPAHYTQTHPSSGFPCATLLSTRHLSPLVTLCHLLVDLACRASSLMEGSFLRAEFHLFVH